MNDDDDDDGIPELIVGILTAATKRAIQSGHPVVLVKDGFLVRIDQSGETILKEIKKVKVNRSPM